MMTQRKDYENCIAKRHNIPYEKDNGTFIIYGYHT